VQSVLGADATCQTIPTGCDCVVLTDYGESHVGTLTTANGVATLSTGETYDYCVADDVLRTRRFDNVGTVYPAVVSSRQ
jgi:hypothetical protein